MFDVHTHFIPSDVLNWLKDHQEQVPSRMEQRVPNKKEFLVVNDFWGFELKDEFIDAALYLVEQKKAGVELSLISPIPQLFLYEFAPEITKEIARVYNQSLAQWVKEHPQRLAALATVPLNNPELAALELQEAMNMGLKGAIIGLGIEQHMLTSDFFAPFWEEANKQKAIIFLHPLLCDDPRLKKNMMPNLIGVPWETTVAATDLILSGHLDKYPQVKIVLAHGGGFLPYQIGRLEKGYQQWKAISKNLQASPIEYVQRLWFDTVLWNEQALIFLLETVGQERVVPGSDYPFDLCQWPPVSCNKTAIDSLLG